MAKSRNTKILLLIRDNDEDDFLFEVWKNLATLRESYLRHVYSRRSRKNKKSNAKKTTAIMVPQNSLAIPKQNFSGSGNVLGFGSDVQKSRRLESFSDQNGNSDISAEVVSAPKTIDKPPVVTLTGVKASVPVSFSSVSVSLPVEVTPVPVPQPATTTTTTKVSSPPVLIPQLVPNLRKDPSPPPRAPSPSPNVCVEPGQPIGPLTLNLSPSPPIRSKEKPSRSWSSLVSLKRPEKPVQSRSDSGTVTRVPGSPPLSNCVAPVLPVSKLIGRVGQKHDDPDRLRWIERREKLEEIGVDLTVATLGRKEVNPWPLTCFCGVRGGKPLYVVWNGVKVGVFQGWDTTNALVNGFHGAGFKKVASEAEAVDILEKNLFRK